MSDLLSLCLRLIGLLSLRLRLGLLSLRLFRHSPGLGGRETLDLRLFLLFLTLLRVNGLVGLVGENGSRLG